MTFDESAKRGDLNLRKTSFPATAYILRTKKSPNREIGAF